MKEHRGGTTPRLAAFLGFGWFLTGIFADGPNRFLPRDRHLPFGSRTILHQCVAFGHRVVFGSRFPILLEERSPVLPGSLATHQDNRDIVDAPSS
jgi:hypothetical protein